MDVDMKADRPTDDGQHEGDRSVVNDEEKRLAGVMGVDPDDPIVQVLRPIAELKEEMSQWKEIDLELLKFLRDTGQGVHRTALNYEKLVNSFAILELHSKESTTQIQQERLALQDLAKAVSKLSTNSAVDAKELNGQLKDLSWRLGWIKDSNDRQKPMWVPLVIAVALAAACGWIGWSRGRLSGYQVGLSETTIPFEGQANAFYWSEVRRLNKETMSRCQEQQLASCNVQLP
ncbi:MAG: hypothetical protein AAF329_04950 [Cyanobacteria bacterium P01_A01_bin.17]